MSAPPELTYPFSKTEKRAYRAMHLWRLCDETLTLAEVVDRVEQRAKHAITAPARARLAALRHWAELFWD